MKNLHNYLTEKLKLSDINKDNLDGRWVDPNTIKVEDITVGSIIEVAKGYKYIYVPSNLAKKLSYMICPMSDFTLVRRDVKSSSTYGYLNFKYSDFPIRDGDSDYNIIKIKLREKDYTTKKELIKDLDKLYNFGDI